MSRRAVIAALGVTQILAWGSTYYLPAVLAGPIVRETHWPLAWVVGGLSLGLLVAALISPRVGRTIEKHGGGGMLAASAVAIGAGQIGLALSPNLAVFIAACLVIGVGMGARASTMPRFATLGRLYGHDARSAITTLTLFGGLASTVCWPLSAGMVAGLGWRETCLVYAAIQLVGALPLYMFAIPRHAITKAAHVDRAPERGTPRLQNPPGALLALLVVTLTLASSLSSLVSVHLLTFLQSGGLALGAAVALGALVGPLQVAARAIELAISRFHHPIWTKFASVTFVAVGLTTLWTGWPVLPAALGFYGAGIGLESIARGTLPLALFGPTGYSTLMGRLAMPSLVAQAAAPWIGAKSLEVIGTGGTLGFLAVVAILNVLLTTALGLIMRRWRSLKSPQFSA
jgi:MFS family permease